MPIRFIIGKSDGSHSEIFEYKGSDTKLPNGCEWAQPSLNAVCKGIGIIQQRERSLLGRSISLETYCRDGVILIGNQDYINKSGGNNTQMAADMAIAKDRVIMPALLINHTLLKETPDNAAYLMGHELAEFYNTPAGKWKERLGMFLTGQPIIDARFMMHSANPLFRLALEMDMFQAELDGKMDHTIPRFTQRRANIDTRNKPAYTSMSCKEMFADCNGLFLGNHPTMPASISSRCRGFSEQKEPYFAPLAEEYMRGPFLLDLVYRYSNPRINTPDTRDYQRYQSFHDKIVSPTATLREHDFKGINDFINEVKRTGRIDKTRLDQEKSILHNAIASFQDELNLAKSEMPGLNV